MENKNDIVILWEAPVIEQPEFRLYYEKDSGKVLFYTCDKPEGDFVIIDKITYAAARHDIRVVNGKISKVQSNLIVTKLVPNKNEGQLCEAEDISIITTDEKNGIRWKLKTYELN